MRVTRNANKLLCSSYRSFNAVFGKVDRCAYKEVVVELLKTTGKFISEKHVQLTNQYLDHKSF